MFRHTFVLVIALLSLLVGCSDDASGNDAADLDGGVQVADASGNVASDGATANNASSPDAASQTGDASMADASMEMMDAAFDSGGADGGADGGIGSNDMGTADMGGADPYAGRPTGQCTVSADCPENPNGKSCNRLLPGGSCGQCGNDTACDDTCQVGTCVTTCNSDDECAPGLRCTGTGRCGAIRCQNDVCPVPLFGCSGSGLCTRVDCSNGESCPSDTTCTAGVCIEDRSLPN